MESDNQAKENPGKVHEERPVSTKEEYNASALNGKAVVDEGKSLFQKG